MRGGEERDGDLRMECKVLTSGYLALGYSPIFSYIKLKDSLSQKSYLHLTVYMSSMGPSYMNVLITF